MDEQKKKLNQIFKLIDLIFLSLLSTQIFFCLVSYIPVREQLVNLNIENVDILKIAIMAFNSVAIIVSKIFSHFKAKKAGELNTLEEKANHYKTYSIMILSIIESMNLVNLVGFLISYDYIFLLMFVIVLVWYFANKPSRKVFMRGYNLSTNESNIVSSLD